MTQGLVLCDKPALLEVVSRTLASTSLQLRQERRWSGEPLQLDGLDLVLAHWEGLDLKGRYQLAEDFSGLRRRPRLIVFSDSTGPEGLGRLFERRAVTQLLAIEPGSFDRRLRLVVELLLHDTPFRPERFLPKWTIHRALRFCSSEAKGAALKEVSAVAEKLALHARHASSLCTVADELVTNALYNAPVNDAGEHRFHQLPRSTPVELPPHQSVQLEVWSDGTIICLGMTDPFGSLSPEKLLGHMAQGLNRQQDPVNPRGGGAGIGLYQTFQSSTHLVASIERGVRTELFVAVDTRGTYREFVERGKSFSLFLSAPRAP